MKKLNIIGILTLTLTFGLGHWNTTKADVAAPPVVVGAQLPGTLGGAAKTDTYTINISKLNAEASRMCMRSAFEGSKNGSYTFQESMGGCLPEFEACVQKVHNDYVQLVYGSGKCISSAETNQEKICPMAEIKKIALDNSNGFIGESNVLIKVQSCFAEQH